MHFLLQRHYGTNTGHLDLKKLNHRTSLVTEVATFTQNHMMVWIARDCWVHLLQPLHQQGHPSSVLISRSLLKIVKGCSQSVVINGSMTRWGPVMSSFPWCLPWDLYSFNIFINNIDDGTERTLSKFPDDTKQRGTDNKAEGINSKGGPNVNLMRFNKAKY